MNVRGSAEGSCTTAAGSCLPLTLTASQELMQQYHDIWCFKTLPQIAECGLPNTAPPPYIYMCPRLSLAATGPNYSRLHISDSTGRLPRHRRAGLMSLPCGELSFSSCGGPSEAPTSLISAVRGVDGLKATTSSVS
ncbi:hypothetical protein Bbelb_300640 [Branchiostoma belcheri]|nr:hypothetical protein Bbelb_300640 [Branchiostoma belcheri]